MKKMKFLILALLFTISLSASAASGEGTKPAEKSARALQIEKRVHEIWKMDFKNMDKIEKQAVKKEIKSFKKEMKATGLDDKVSISIGAIIIIILVLIII